MPDTISHSPLNTIDDVMALPSNAFGALSRVCTYDNFAAVAMTSAVVTGTILRHAITALVIAIYFTYCFGQEMGRRRESASAVWWIAKMRDRRLSGVIGIGGAVLFTADTATCFGVAR